MWISKKSFDLIMQEKDARIADLKAQVESLSQVALPARAPYAVPVSLREADGILTNDGEVREYAEEEVKQAVEVQQEAARILAGNY